jgi:hypothetical protein
MDSTIILVGLALVAIGILAGVAYGLNAQDPDYDFNKIMAIGSPIILALIGGLKFVMGAQSEELNKNINSRSRR